MDALKMTVAERRQLTEHICEFTLAPADGEKLPSFTAGAHITVRDAVGCDATILACQ